MELTATTRTRRHWLGALLGAPAAGAAGALLLAAPGARTAEAAPFMGIPVTGTVQNGGTFAGTLNVTRFDAQGGQLFALGTLTGTLTNALGNIIGTVTNVPVTLPVTAPAAQATCTILHLELGPLDLNLLGLMVHLDRVVLDITAQQGPGNLLGNLLCAIANLLNNPSSPAGGLAGLLNNVLRVLG